MRKLFSMTLVGAVALTVLSGCSAPNGEAVEAAADYSTQLTAWTTALAGAGEELAPVLQDAPSLEKFDGVDHTPTYLAARDVARRIDAVVAELAALEADELDDLDTVADDAYWVIADLYYDTLGAAADRLNALSASLDIEDDGEAIRVRTSAHLAFAEARVGFLERAIDELPAVTPESGLGVSVSAFAEDWYLEELAFQEAAVEQITGWEVLSYGYKEFWNFGNLNEIYRAPREFSATLRPGFVQLAQDLAAELATAVDATDAAAPELPAVGDPYRALLLAGYLPWGDPVATPGYAANRLWALWRIRELEKTPDPAYQLARVTLMEELNRGLEEGEGEDFRPGATRLLDTVRAYSDAFDSLWDVDERWITELSEVHGYGIALRDHPMTPDVAAAFDEVLGLYEELNLEIAELAESLDDEDDLYDAVTDLGEEYQDKVLDAASPALAALDDDAEFEKQLAEAITATTPGG